jgi:TfoX/Sxy family transcriptional regulator of competence genes
MERNMASDQDYVDFIIEMLSSQLEVTCRKMFGEYAIYLDGKIVALICDNRLFVKKTDEGAKFAGNLTEESPYPGAKPALLIEDRLEDREWLIELVRITAAALPVPKKKK